ncbi:MAG: JAB domain-containing protein [Anaerolineales bacterium]|jgi:DNA repair protein RadC|nr:MAG: JAB domain-containing protein [Anaerolineales bacterium]
MGDVEYHTLIKEMPKSERPRERLELYGEAALSNAELIAIALRTGSRTENALGLAQRLLTAFQGLGGLAQASVRELCEVSGIGPAKAAQLKAALELGRRLILSSGDSRPRITCPADAANLFLAAMSTEAQEQLRVMLLDSRHRVQRMSVVYVGNVNTSMIRVAEVFRQAVKDNSAAIVVAHNHPSGDPTPSPEDVRVTEQMVRAGKMLDIEVLDHLIIGKQRYVSLKERGLGFK